MEREAGGDASRAGRRARDRRATGWSRRRSGIAPRAPATRSCTRTCSSPTSTLGADGRWSTLDGRRIYAHAKTAGYLYEARLRALLTRELGVEWTPVRNGIADIDGVPPTVLRAFSRRRADIEAELERRGASSAAAAQVAALADPARARTTASRRSSSCRSGASARAELGLDHETVTRRSADASGSRR